ncbi:MAG: hypothetical protein AMJ54_10930 [Deltaproteobacteria bacterium SG8_13]|nr:MAG: hypothetical protein AMJ54_10930 [Deltaproteobacteria bacterium SG8_13]
MNHTAIPLPAGCGDGTTMKNRKQWLVLLSAAALLIALMASADNSSSVAENRNLAKVTFVVS